jgi:hypothetical protein
VPIPYAENLSADLCQGDVLKRTPELESILSQYHRHFYEHSKNQFFIVLTQSCDLVPRNGGCTSRYITLAAVRRLSVAFEREFAQFRKDELELPFAVSTYGARQKMHDFLQRLANNNESKYFFLRRFPERSFPDDCCAILSLSVPIKADEHYSTCQDAKILELDSEFQAKLGWLVGQLYSRVGTRDLTDDEVRVFVRQILETAAVWVDEKVLDETSDRVQRWRQDNPGGLLTESDLKRIVAEIPTRSDKVFDRIAELLEVSQTLTALKDRGYLPARGVERIMRGLRQDALLRSLLKD